LTPAFRRRTGERVRRAVWKLSSTGHSYNENAMLFPTLSFIGASSAQQVYDIYYPSIHRGTVSISRHGNRIDLDSKPGFAPDNAVHIQLDGERIDRAEVTTGSDARTSYSFGARKVPGDKSLTKTALYSPTQPGLLPYLLAEYDTTKRGFQKLAATDLTKGTPRDVTAELYRT